MKRQLYNDITKCIASDKKHIEEFILTSDVGTKRLQAKFHNMAIKERNIYIDKEIKKFQTYKDSLSMELKNRANSLWPQDNSEKIAKETEALESLYQAIKINNKHLENGNKLGFLKTFIILDANSSASLYRINKLLLLFIKKFKDFSIILKAEDFNYSMFTYVYMDSFFQNIENSNFYNIMQKKFESIYWECPDLVIHLKLNIYYLLKKYQYDIDSYLDSLANDLLVKEQLNTDNALATYSKRSLELANLKRIDAFIYLTNFLNKKYVINEYLTNSSTRIKSFNTFASTGDYAGLPPLAKVSFVNEMANLENTLIELKNYYLYQDIINDLIEKYKSKENIKDLYSNKQKDILKEEKVRLKIYKSYQRAMGIGFMASNNLDKQKALKMQMNEQVSKLNTLYDQLYDLEIKVKINKNINAGSTIFDLLETSLESFYYLKNIMTKQFGEKEDFDLAIQLDKYFDFIYSYSNTFINKINVNTSYDVGDIVTEKYRLSSLNIVKDMITKDNLDTTLDTVKYINRCNNINKSTLSIEEMAFIYNVKEIETNEEKKND